MRERASGQRRQVGRQRGEGGQGRGRRVEGEAQRPAPGTTESSLKPGSSLYTLPVWQVEAVYLVNGVYRTHTKSSLTLDEMEEWKRHLVCEVETCVQAIGGKMP